MLFRSWEVELGVVIGTRARYASKQDALEFVAGYCIANDVSERHFQLESTGQWTKGKGCETFGPLGPWLVTADEIPAPQSLSMWLDVNGDRMQKGSTRTMIFHVGHIVSYVSQFMVLEPGDVIATGTQPGVGQGKKPPKFLKAGDIVSLGMVSGLAVRDGHVAFALEIDPARAARLEPLRKAAEEAVDRLPGVLSVSAVLTAHGPARGTT